MSGVQLLLIVSVVLLPLGLLADRALAGPGSERRTRTGPRPAGEEVPPPRPAARRASWDGAQPVAADDPRFDEALGLLHAARRAGAPVEVRGAQLGHLRATFSVGPYRLRFLLLPSGDGPRLAKARSVVVEDLVLDERRDLWHLAVTDGDRRLACTAWLLECREAAAPPGLI